MKYEMKNAPKNMTIIDVHNITLKLGISMIFTQIRKVRDKKISDPVCKEVIHIDLLKVLCSV